MKIAAALLLLAVAGCAGPCQDYVEHKLLFGNEVAQVYHECTKKCCRAKEPRECSCTSVCSCKKGHPEAAAKSQSTP